MADAANSDQNSTDSLEYKAPRATFLVLFILAGVIGNALVIICIVFNPKIRRLARFIFTINLAVVNIVECLINVSIQLADIVTSLDLSKSEAMCRTNAFFLNLVWVEGMLLIFFMSLERTRAFKQNPDGKEILHSPWRVLVIILYTWVHSSLFSLPLAFNMVPVSFYSDINTCTIDQTASIVYISTLAGFCFIIPFIVIIIFFVVTVRLIFQQRRPMRAIITRNQYSGEIGTPMYDQEKNGTKFAFAVFLFWLFLVGSFVTVLFVNLYQLYSSVNKDGSIVYMFFLWTKYLFVIVFPILTIFIKKEMWGHFKDLVCKKNNPVVGVAKSQYGNGSIEVRQGDHSDVDSIKNAHHQKTDPPHNSFIHDSGFQVPVLFAMSNGVHIQTYGHEDDMSDSYVIDDLGVRGKKLDVLGSQNNLQNTQTDTSDYDSGNEADPFSVSHPVSSKSAGLPTDVLQRRSNSQPEVRRKPPKTPKSSVQLVSVCVTSAADSGVDVSMHEKRDSVRKKRDLAEEDSGKHSLTRTMSSKNVLMVNDNTISVLTDSDSTQHSGSVGEKHKRSRGEKPSVSQGEADIISELIESPLRHKKKKKRKKHKHKETKEEGAVDNNCPETPKRPSKLLPLNSHPYTRMKRDSEVRAAEERTSGVEVDENSALQDSENMPTNDGVARNLNFRQESLFKRMNVDKSPLKSIMKKKPTDEDPCQLKEPNLHRLDLAASDDFCTPYETLVHDLTEGVTTPSSCTIALDTPDDTGLGSRLKS